MNRKTDFDDWLAIHDGIHAYCRGLDRRDAEALASVFWPDAVVNLGSSVDIRGSEYADTVIPALKRMFHRTMHMIGNIRIDIDGSSATSECSLLAYHAMIDGENPAQDVIVGGRYLDRWEKRSGEWRMIRRQLVWDWHRTLGNTQNWEECLLGVPLVSGKFRPDDPLYQSK